MTDNDELNKICLEKTLQTAKSLNTDLLEASYSLGCCAECAKLRGRWFSISGNDKRFPKFPEVIDCDCYGILFFPVFPFSKPKYEPAQDDIIEFSNRPFIDDRTDYEKETYEIYKLKRATEKFWAPYDERWRAISEYDHEQYDRIQKELPEIAPKSFSGYMRMKKQNTKNFRKLVDVALQKSIFLEYPAEIVCEIEILTPIREKYIKNLCKIAHMEHDHRSRSE